MGNPLMPNPQQQPPSGGDEALAMLARLGGNAQAYAPPAADASMVAGAPQPQQAAPQLIPPQSSLPPIGDVLASGLQQGMGATLANFDPTGQGVTIANESPQVRELIDRDVDHPMAKALGFALSLFEPGPAEVGAIGKAAFGLPLLMRLGDDVAEGVVSKAAILADKEAKALGKGRMMTFISYEPISASNHARFVVHKGDELEAFISVNANHDLPNVLEIDIAAPTKGKGFELFGNKWAFEAPKKSGASFMGRSQMREGAREITETMYDYTGKYFHTIEGLRPRGTQSIDLQRFLGGMSG